MKNRYLYITLLSVLALQAEAQGQRDLKPVPRLVVNIAIDQLRSDRLEALMPQYGEEGLRKMWQEGLVFEHASYPFRPDRASAISSLVTGTTPFYHTITGERWISRETLQPVYCTDHQRQKGQPSAQHLAVSTLSDELKMATHGQGKVMSVAPTADAAILSAGHHTDKTCWNSHPKQHWTHRDITQQALQCVTEGSLGQDTIPDLLFLTYDASDKGEQTYTLLDQEIARLMGGIEAQVGQGKTLYVVTSTGYDQTSQAEYSNYQIPTGTFYINRAANLMNMYFGALWGTGTYVEACYQDQLYISHRLLETKRISMDEILRKGKDFLIQMAGVKQVEAHPYETHIGDLVIRTAPGWQIENEDTHEQTQLKNRLAYMPIIVFGPGIQATTIQTPVSVLQIAPAIAKAIRIRAPNACEAEPLF